MFISGRELEDVALPSSVRRTAKGYLDDLMLCELIWQKGMVGEGHRHPHRQCGYIVKGSFEARVDGETRILRAGDCFSCRPMHPAAWFAWSTVP